MQAKFRIFNCPDSEIVNKSFLWTEMRKPTGIKGHCFLSVTTFFAGIFSNPGERELYATTFFCQLRVSKEYQRMVLHKATFLMFWKSLNESLPSPIPSQEYN